MFARRSNLVDLGVETLKQRRAGVERARIHGVLLKFGFTVSQAGVTLPTCSMCNLSKPINCVACANGSICVGQTARMHRVRPKNKILYHQALYGSDAP
jgi:hypothetical protein